MPAMHYVLLSAQKLLFQLPHAEGQKKNEMYTKYKMQSYKLLLSSVKVSEVGGFFSFFRRQLHMQFHNLFFMLGRHLSFGRETFLGKKK